MSNKGSSFSIFCVIILTSCFKLIHVFLSECQTQSKTTEEITQNNTLETENHLEYWRVQKTRFGIILKEKDGDTMLPQECGMICLKRLKQTETASLYMLTYQQRINMTDKLNSLFKLAGKPILKTK